MGQKPIRNLFEPFYFAPSSNSNISSCGVSVHVCVRARVHAVCVYINQKSRDAEDGSIQLRRPCHTQCWPNG